MEHTLCPFYSSLEDPTTLKQASFCSFLTGLLPDVLFAKFLIGHHFIKILKKPKAIAQGAFFGGRKNVLRKVIHLKVNEKRN